MKQAYKSYRMIENVKMQKVLSRFRVIEYTGMHIVIFTVMFTFDCFLVLNICSYFV